MVGERGRRKKKKEEGRRKKEEMGDVSERGRSATTACLKRDFTTHDAEPADK
jgi:hypothetical protein